MLKKYFIPHSENDYKPHVFREVSVAVLLAIILIVFVSCSAILPAINKSKLTAAIYSSVIVQSTNKDRESEALSELTVNPLLVEAAQEKANDMAAKGYFAHNSPDGRQPWDWIRQAGYSYVYAGENLAIDFTDSEDVERAWMNSPGHRANILSNHFTEIGVATAKGELDGKETVFVVQMFGSPKSAVVAVSKPEPEPVETVPENAVAPISESKPKQEPLEAPTGPETPEAIPSKNVESENNFVAVKNNENGQNEVQSIPAPIVLAANYNANWFEKLIVNPSHTLKVIYFILILFLVLSLILYIFIERRVQHPKNISYGVMLLLIVIVLLGMHWILFISQGLVT